MTTEGNQDDDLLGDEQELRNIETNNVSIETFMNGWFRYHLNEKK